MPYGPNDVAETETLSRSSVQLPAWMTEQLDGIARRTFSSRSQVIRQLLAEGLERERTAETAEVA